MIPRFAYIVCLCAYLGTTRLQPHYEYCHVMRQRHRYPLIEVRPAGGVVPVLGSPHLPVQMLCDDPAAVAPHRYAGPNHTQPEEGSHTYIQFIFCGLKRTRQNGSSQCFASVLAATFPQCSCVCASSASTERIPGTTTTHKKCAYYLHLCVFCVRRRSGSQIRLCMLCVIFQTPKRLTFRSMQTNSVRDCSEPMSYLFFHAACGRAVKIHNTKAIVRDKKVRTACVSMPTQRERRMFDRAYGNR